MRFLHLTLAALLAGASYVAAEPARDEGSMWKNGTEGGGGKGAGKAGEGGMGEAGSQKEPAQCREIAMLSALVNVANNETRLNAASHNNATRAAEIKASASSAAPKLKALEANGTLAETCQQVKAAMEDSKACKQMKEFQRMQRIAANATELNKVTKNNTAKAEEIKAAVSKNKPALEALQSNMTLTQLCSVEDTNNQCRRIATMQQEMALVQNQTALQAQFHGNQSKIDQFQQKAARDSQLLAKLENNKTLTDICKAGGSSELSPSPSFMPCRPPRKSPFADFCWRISRKHKWNIDGELGCIPSECLPVVIFNKAGRRCRSPASAGQLGDAGRPVLGRRAAAVGSLVLLGTLRVWACACVRKVALDCPLSPHGACASRMLYFCRSGSWRATLYT
jgi:hypothetical protein